MKFLSIVGLLIFFGSMFGMFVFIRGADPSPSLLLLFLATFVGGAVLAVWAQNKKFPDRFFMFALISGYLSFIFFGFARVARAVSLEEAVPFLMLAVMMGICSVVFGLSSDEVKKKKNK
ncbi:MAG: hypothetical protein HYX21_02180 [Candidatus Yanofskybacteria bacterium]|nr:hypothetical protein [Candidatus Yanofskybacteria bacterium]